MSFKPARRPSPSPFPPVLTASKTILARTEENWSSPHIFLSSPQWGSLRVGFPLRHLARDLLTRHLARDLSQGFLVAPLGLPLLFPSLFFALLRRSPVPVGRGVGEVGPEEVHGNREDDGGVLVDGDLSHSLEEPQLQSRRALETVRSLPQAL